MIKNKDLENQPINSSYIYSGHPLNIGEAFRVSISNTSKVIILAGPPACGKTTILSYLNDAFQHREIKKLKFAGSYTLKGLEICSHLSRMASNKSIPDTDRTKVIDENPLM